MKKIFIGLLIIAAGAATLFALQKTIKPSPDSNVQKDHLTGNWKLDSVWLVKDSASEIVKGLLAIEQPGHHFNFRTDGSIVLSLNDSLVTDSSQYDWTTDGRLIWSELNAPATIDTFLVPKLTPDSLLLRSADGVDLLFIRMK